jgi:hypothetical protein
MCLHLYTSFARALSAPLFFADIVYHIVKQHEHALTKLANVVDKSIYKIQSELALDLFWSRGGRHSNGSSLAVLRLGLTMYTKSNFLLYTFPDLHKQFIIHVLNYPSAAGQTELKNGCSFEVEVGVSPHL